MPSQSVNASTSEILELPRGVVRYVPQQSATFDQDCFDTQALSKRGLLDGMAKAGRGNTTFFTLEGQQLVLRHYRRGGLAQHVSKTRYLFTGMNKTRAFREFDMLMHLQRANLPASRPYACRVLRHGIFYTASLVTYKFPGQTLAERMQSSAGTTGARSLNNSVWRNIGATIARFHAAGVYHADLNAHNIMLGEDNAVALIDFDRSRLSVLPVTPSRSGWCLDNINRLGRSIAKVDAAQSAENARAAMHLDGYAACQQQWQESIAETQWR